MFGKPKEGAHALRVFNLAIVDVLLTVVAAFVISQLIHIPFWLTLLTLFIIAVVIHRLFCVNTTVNKMIFGEV